MTRHPIATAFDYNATGYNAVRMSTIVFNGATAVLAAAEALPYGVAITDPHGILTWVNAAYAQLAGCTTDELLGQSAGEFDWDALAKAPPSSEPWRGQSLCRRQTGEAYEVEQSVTTLRTSAGTVTGFWIVKRDSTGLKRDGFCHNQAEANLSALTSDITEQKNTEEALHQKNESLTNAEVHYHRLFNSLSDSVLVFKLEKEGLSSHCIDANDHACRFLGYTREELLNLRVIDIDPPENHPAATAIVHQLFSQGHLVREQTIVAKGGRRLPVEINSHVFDLDSSPMMISCVRDISDRKRMQDALRKSEEKFSKAFLSSPAIITLVDMTQAGRLVDVNEAFERVVGYRREDVLGHTTTDLELWADRGEYDESVKQFNAAGRLRNFEHRFRRKNGAVGTGLTSADVIELDGKPFVISATIDITARRNAEAALYESERRLREMLANTHLVTAMLDEAGNITFCNDSLLRLTGWNRDELIGRGWCSLLVPDGQYTRDLFSKQVSEKTIPIHHENAIVTKTGERHTISWNNTMLFDAAGKPIGVATIGEDITERKRMQDALRKSTEALAKLFRSNPTTTMLFKLVDTEYRIADVNEAFEQRTGYRREEVMGRTMEELGLWADPSEGIEYIKRFRGNGRVTSFEHRFRRNNGDIGVCLSSAESIEIDGVPCAIAATIDITQQKQVEDTMRSLVTAIEQSADTIVITDLNGTIQYCNPAFERVTGYSKKEAIGRNPRILKSGKHNTELYKGMWATITQGSVWTGHLINKRKDGSLYEEDATISPIRDALGKVSGFVAVKRDVTKQLELERQLQQSQKLESVGRLAGGVAHDFNNLLTVINGYSGFLVKRLKTGDPLRAYADEIKIAGERAASLTKQLLAFSRKELIEPRVLDLNTTIRESAPMLQRLIGEDITLKIHLEDSLGQVMADREQIHQVVMNLVVNARDAMPDGGRIDIQTTNFELGAEASTALHPKAMAGRYVLMTVTDNGHGIDETTRERIFEPFFTTKEVGKGTGLGLSTVYGIIKQSGGWIDVVSEVGVGTSFMVFLPLIDECPVPERDGTNVRAEGGSETILLVEDQDVVRSFAVAALTQVGYHVIEAPNGDDAIAIAKQHSGQIHLLLTDVVMPGMNGKELSGRLMELRPNLKVLFISGYTADVIADRGVRDRGVALLHKPFSPEELAQKVREVLVPPPEP